MGLWCVEQSLDPWGPILFTLFGSDLATNGQALRSVNTFQFTISASHIPVVEVTVQKHPTAMKLLRGIGLHTLDVNSFEFVFVLASE